MKFTISATQAIINTQKVRHTSLGIRELNNIEKRRKKITDDKAVTIENINPRFVQMEYPVREDLFLRAIQIEKELKEGAHKPFKKVIGAHIGNFHAVGQVPISFIRQVLACVSYPELIRNNIFPEDVKDRAARILSSCGGNSIGSYSADIGYETVRRSVAEYIETRDGFKANPENIYLTPGASVAIKGCLQLLINNIDGKQSGVMIPIPQCPFYSACLIEYGFRRVDYYLDENKNWEVSQEELERSFEEGSKICNIRALVVVHPGNPSGQLMTRKNIETIIKFAHRKSLFIFADEVYQNNIYKGKFQSFKKILMELGNPYNQTELVSFMSASYGYTGEGGIRGGWMEIVNMDPDVQFNLFKCISARLCPPTLGQTVIYCIAKPPVKGDPSYELYLKERTSILKLFNETAQKIVDNFNKTEGLSCNAIQGGLYAFPRINLPPKAIKVAKEAGLSPDVFYAFKLLEETGICVLPGSEFGQKPGTFHFRATILPHSNLQEEMNNNFQRFHKKITNDFS